MLHHTMRNVLLVVQGDDVWATGIPQDLAWFDSGNVGTFEGFLKGRLLGRSTSVLTDSRAAQRMAANDMPASATQCC